MGQSSISMTLVLTILGAMGAIIALAILGWLFTANLNDRTQASQSPGTPVPWRPPGRSSPT